MLVDYEHYRRNIIPKLLTAWDRRCFCAAPGFLKLMTFNFEDYGSSPACCFDTENLCDLLIYPRFNKLENSGVVDGDQISLWSCPQCGVRCRTYWQDFSISMSRSYCKFESVVTPSKIGIFLLGGRSYEHEFFQRISDFREATSEAEYLKCFDIN